MNMATLSAGSLFDLLLWGTRADSPNMLTRRQLNQREEFSNKGKTMIVEIIVSLYYKLEIKKCGYTFNA